MPKLFVKIKNHKYKLAAATNPAATKAAILIFRVEVFCFLKQNKTAPTVEIIAPIKNKFPVNKNPSQFLSRRFLSLVLRRTLYQKFFRVKGGVCGIVFADCNDVIRLVELIRFYSVVFDFHRFAGFLVAE